MLASPICNVYVCLYVGRYDVFRHCFQGLKMPTLKKKGRGRGILFQPVYIFFELHNCKNAGVTISMIQVEPFFIFQGSKKLYSCVKIAISVLLVSIVGNRSNGGKNEKSEYGIVLAPKS